MSVRLDRSKKLILVGLLIVAVIVAGLVYNTRWARFHPLLATMPPVIPAPELSPFQQAVVTSLNRQVAANIRYQDGYYTGGDPPAGIGVCTDVVIRSYQAAGVDLKRRVAEDVNGHSALYNIARPDPNIDHRRCRNLAVFFKRKALVLPANGPKADWEPGDIVLWGSRGDGKPDHIGVIGNHLDADGIPTVVHHWPGLPVSEMDFLYQLPILYHFRWRGATGHAAVPG